MTPMERTLAALAHREGDRPPVFLLFTTHGARELGRSIEDYCGSAEDLVEGQLRLRAKFGHDCLFAFFHAAVEHEAWGGHTHFLADGPPNAGDLLMRNAGQIACLQAPVIADQPGLQRVLRAITALKERSRGEVPVLGVVLSPFSVPVMQLGFSGYLDLLLEAEASPGGHAQALLEHLLALNAEFAVGWGNAQLAAGATVLAYFDPLSSSTITSPSLGVHIGLTLATRVLAKLRGPAAMHFASGRISSRLDAAIATGASVLGVSAEDDLGELKRRCAGKVALLGNLNGVQMVHWSAAEADAQTRRSLDAAAHGGGFILADNHGEIPFQVKDEVLHAIVQATAAWAS